MLERLQRVAAIISIAAAFILAPGPTLHTGYEICLQRSEADADIPVFDAAAYVNLAKSLGYNITMTEQQLQQINLALNLYNEVVTSHKLTIQQIWPLAAPYITKLAKNAGASIQLDDQAQQLFLAFSSQYKGWQPGTPYGQVYQSLIDGQRSAIADQLRVAQLANEELAKENVSLDTLAHASPKTEQDALSVAAQIGVQQTRAIQALHQTFAAQLASESRYTNALLAAQEQQHRDPGLATLNAFLSAAPSQLR